MAETKAEQLYAIENDLKDSPSVTTTKNQEIQRREQFISFFGWTRWIILVAGLALLAGGFITRLTLFFVWGSITLGFCLALVIAVQLARAGHLVRGVYLVVGAVFLGFLPLPLFVSGLLPLYVSGYIAAITLVGLYLSPELIPRTTVIAGALFTVPALLELWAPFSTQSVPNLGAFLALVALLSVGILVYLFGNTLQQSLDAATSYAEQLESSRVELIARSSELQATATDLATQRAELEKANRQLEQAAREEQRRATMLQASSEVSRAIAQIQDLDRLLPQITNLVSQHFGFYHVGVFLVDEPSGYAVLRAANSVGGQRMLARQHKLKVGSEGIVGYVTSTGQPRIALDVGVDAHYFDNPDLPETHSEVALPLYSGDQLIGALDVQSTQESAFDQQDITVLTALADQVAIAIQNVNLFQQAQTALAEAQETYQRFLRQEWDSFLGGRPKPTDRLETVRKPVNLETEVK